MIPPPIRVSIIEDDRGTRDGYVSLLQKAPHITCLGLYGSAEEAERELPSCLPDLALVDINLPGRSGIECVRRLKRSHPQLEFLMITSYDDTSLIFDALRAGASGYILKRAVPESLVTAIDAIKQGGSPMSPQIARKVVSHFHQIRKPINEVETLTNREKEILELVAKGLIDKEIADRLGLSPFTVNHHLRNIYGKLHVQSRMEAVSKVFGQSQM